MSFERIKSNGAVGTEEELAKLAKPKPGEVCGSETRVVNGGGVEGIGDGAGDGI